MSVLTVAEKIALLAPMPAKDAARVTWLTDTLRATPGARAGLAQWTAAGCPPSPVPAQLAVMGDRRLRRIVETAVSRIDVPPVRWALQAALFVVVGQTSRAWVHDYPVFPPGVTPALVVIGGDVDDDEEGLSIIGHECGHVWLRDRCDPLSVDRFRDPAPTIGDLVTEWGIPAERVAEYLKPHQLNEWRAAKLAAEWGFTGPAADPTRARAAARLP